MIPARWFLCRRLLRPLFYQQRMANATSAISSMTTTLWTEAPGRTPKCRFAQCSRDAGQYQHTHHHGHSGDSGTNTATRVHPVFLPPTAAATLTQQTPPPTMSSSSVSSDGGGDGGLEESSDDTAQCIHPYNVSPGSVLCPSAAQWPTKPVPPQRGKYFQARRSASFVSPLIPRPHLQRVLLLEKLTRWEVLCNQATGSAEVARMKHMFPGMFETYIAHTVAINHIMHLLREVHGLHVHHLKAQTTTSVDLTNIDAIIAAGGDGTFLEAASLVRPSGVVPSSTAQPLWVFGINTDPSRSEGNLLMKPSTSSVVTKRKSSSCFIRRSTDVTGFPRRERPPLRRSGTTVRLQENTGKDSFFHLSKDNLDSGHISETLEGLRLVIDKIVHGTYAPIRRRRIRVTLVDPELPLLDGSIGTLRLPSRLLRPAPASRSGLTDLQLSSRPAQQTATKKEKQFLGRQYSTPDEKPYLFQPERMDGWTPSSSSFISCSRQPRQPRHPENVSTPALSDSEIQGRATGTSLDDDDRSHEAAAAHHRDQGSEKEEESPKQHHHRLDYLAVNDVLVTSQQSHMSFYVEWSVDGSKPQRSKNSGLIISTGSGSSAWAYNISKISEGTVEAVIQQFIARQPPHVRQSVVPVDSAEICRASNQLLVFDPSDPQMRLVVREPIDNRVFATQQPSILGRKISLRPLTQDAVICLDGISIVPVQFGQTIILEIDYLEDSILTAV